MFRRFLAFTLTVAVVSQAFDTDASQIFFDDLGDFDAATAAILVEDLEATGQTLGVELNPFSSNGIRFEGLAGSVSPHVVLVPANFPNFATPPTSTVLTANGDEDILISFDTAMSAVGFDVYLNDLGPATVTGFDADGGTLFVQNLGGNSSMINFFGVTSITGIKSLRFTTTLGRVINTAVDNFRLVAVPEPSSIALGLLGTAGLGILTRRRTNKR